MSVEGLRKRKEIAGTCDQKEKEKSSADNYKEHQILDSKPKVKTDVHTQSTKQKISKAVQELPDKQKNEDDKNMFTPSEKMYFLLLLLFTILSVITRLHNIEKPTHIWYVTYICLYHNHCVIFMVVLGDHCNFVPDWYELRLTYKLYMCA